MRPDVFWSDAEKDWDADEYPASPAGFCCGGRAYSWLWLPDPGGPGSAEALRGPRWRSLDRERGRQLTGDADGYLPRWQK